MTVESDDRSPITRSAQPVLLVYPADQGQEIDLLEVIKLLWDQKLLILIITIMGAIAGAGYAFLSTPIYESKALLAPNKSERGASLPSGLDGLASLAGISIGTSADDTEALATLRSNAFIEDFIKENDLLPVLFADEWDAEASRWRANDPADWPNIEDGVELFNDEVRSVDEDVTTGMVTLTIRWSDPELAAEWVESLVQRVNERLRRRDLNTSSRRLGYLNDQLEKASLVELRQAISRLIENEIQTMMLAQAETEYAFKVIDPPRVPNEHVAPQRALVVFGAVILGGALGVVVVITRSTVLRRDRLKALPQADNSTTSEDGRS